MPAQVAPCGASDVGHHVADTHAGIHLIRFGVGQGQPDLADSIGYLDIAREVLDGHLSDIVMDHELRLDRRMNDVFEVGVCLGAQRAIRPASDRKLSGDAKTILTLFHRGDRDAFELFLRHGPLRFRKLLLGRSNGGYLDFRPVPALDLYLAKRLFDLDHTLGVERKRLCCGNGCFFSGTRLYRSWQDQQPSKQRQQCRAHTEPPPGIRLNLIRPKEPVGSKQLNISYHTPGERYGPDEYQETRNGAVSLKSKSSQVPPSNGTSRKRTLVKHLLLPRSVLSRI